MPESMKREVVRMIARENDHGGEEMEEENQSYSKQKEGLRFERDQ